MKRFMNIGLILIITMIFAGCLGGQPIGEDTGSRITAYVAGKGIALTVNQLPKLAEKNPGLFTGATINTVQLHEDLGAEYDVMMASKVTDPETGSVTVPPDAILTFSNSAVSIFGKYVKDPAGLLGDLTMLLSEFGATYDSEGNLEGIQPIPFSILQRFAWGYDNGKNVYL